VAANGISESGKEHAVFEPNLAIPASVDGSGPSIALFKTGLEILTATIDGIFSSMTERPPSNMARLDILDQTNHICYVHNKSTILYT
jgi:hypothetical protein